MRANLTYLNLLYHGNNLISVKDVGITRIQRALTKLHSIVTVICFPRLKSRDAFEAIPSVVDKHFGLWMRAVVAVHDEAGNSAKTVHPLWVKVETLVIHFKLD